MMSGGSRLRLEIYGAHYLFLSIVHVYVESVEDLELMYLCQEAFRFYKVEYYTPIPQVGPSWMPRLIPFFHTITSCKGNDTRTSMSCIWSILVPGDPKFKVSLLCPI